MTNGGDRDEIPLFERAARDAGGPKGMSADEVLAADRRRLFSVAYPGPQCLEPHEIELIGRSGLPVLGQARRLHVQTCSGCAALVAVVSGESPSARPDAPAAREPAATRAEVATMIVQLSRLAEQMTELKAEVKSLRISMLRGPLAPDDVPTPLERAQAARSDFVEVMMLNDLLRASPDR